MHHLIAATLCLTVLPVSAALAQSESVISEYTLGGELINRFGGAGVDSGIGNMKVIAGSDDQIYTIRDNLPNGPQFLGEVRIFDRSGIPVSTFDVAPLNPDDAPLTGISVRQANLSNNYVFVSTGFNESNANSNGRILRYNTVNSSTLVIRPFLNESVAFNDVCIDRYFSATRGDDLTDDQMGRFNSNGGSRADTFSPTGRSVRHLDLLFTPANLLGAIVAPNDPMSDGYGWKLFSGSGDTLVTVNKGTLNDFDPRGFEVRNGFLWTFNKATGNLEKYLVNGLLEDSYPMTGLGTDVSDFTFTPDGKILFTHIVPVPTPGTSVFASLFGVVLATRRRR